MSAFPLEADISSCPGDVGFGPKADINDVRSIARMWYHSGKRESLDFDPPKPDHRTNSA
jgi:hypothetical protein